MTEEPRRRLDERAMTAGTTIRFVLLVVLMLVASGSMMLQVLTALSGSGSYGCLLAAGADPGQGFAQSVLVVEPQYDAYQACMARFQPPPPWWAIYAWPALLPVVAIALFRVLPAWKARRGRVVPLESIDRDGELRRTVDELVAVAGLTHKPRLLVDPAAASTSAVVFGSNRRPTVCLHGGLIVRGRADPQGFRAVVLHELAHVRNGDVTLTWITVAVWRVFLVAVLVPFLAWIAHSYITGPGSPNWASDAPVVTRGLLLAVFAVVLVTLARSDVLRSREVYADRTAVRWGADPRSWAVTASSQAGGAVRRVVGSFAELWRTHPRWDLRRESLGDPLMLFGLRALPMFLTGAAAAVINFHLASELTPYGLHGSWVGLTGELAAAMLVTGVAGIILWRAVGHAALTGRRVPSGVVAGLWLGIGMAVGELVNDQGAVFQWLPDHPEALLLVVFAAVVFALWVAQCARLWIRTWPGRSIHSPMLVALAAAGLALASWFAWWRSDGLLLTSGLPVSPSMVRDALAQQAIVVPAGQSGTLTVIAVVFPVMAGLLEPPLVLATAVALWLIPLLAWTTRVPQTTGWAPTTVPGAAGGPGEAVPSLRRVLLPGLLGGVLCWTAVAGVQVYLHPLRPHDRREAGGFALIYVGWLLVAVVGATAVAALAASVLAGRYRLLVALIAGGTATVTGLAGAFVLASVDGCVRPLSILQSSCGWRPAGTWPYFGLLLAPSLVVGALVAVVGTAVGLVFGARLSRHASREIRLTTRRVTVAALGLAAVGVVAAAVLSGVRNSTGAGVGARALFRPAADVPVSDRTRATQVIAWFKFGGDDLESRIVDAEQRLAATLSKLANSPTDDIDASPLLPICADIGSIARNAAGYFRIPDPEAQQHWQVFITQAEQGSRDCEKAVGSNQGDLFERALTELTEAATAGSVASERINAVMAPG